MTTVTEDVKALRDAELFRRLSAAIRAIPGFSEADPQARQRAWDEAFRYHDELARRYPPRTASDSSVTT
jgi:hypothetical protein